MVSPSVKGDVQIHQLILLQIFKLSTISIVCPRLVPIKISHSCLFSIALTMLTSLLLSFSVIIILFHLTNLHNFKNLDVTEDIVEDSNDKETHIYVSAIVSF